MEEFSGHSGESLLKMALTTIYPESQQNDATEMLQQTLEPGYYSVNDPYLNGETAIKYVLT